MRASLRPELLKGLPGASAMLPHMPPPSALPQPMLSAACTAMSVSPNPLQAERGLVCVQILSLPHQLSSAEGLAGSICHIATHAAAMCLSPANVFSSLHIHMHFARSVILRVNLMHPSPMLQMLPLCAGPYLLQEPC